MRSDWKSLKSIYNAAFLCGLGVFFVGFLIPIVAYTDLGASGIQVALIFSLFTLFSAIVCPIAGRFAKNGKNRQSILIGTLLKASAYMGMAYSISLGSIELLILSSPIWGTGSAFYLVGSDAEISERVLSENRSEAFGHRSAASSRGSIIGTFIGFFVLLSINIYAALLVFAIANILAGIIVVIRIPEKAKVEMDSNPFLKQSAIGRGVLALIIVMAVHAFVVSLVAPFVELYVLERVTTDFSLVALAYLPAGIVTGFLGGKIGKLGDRASKVKVVSISAVTFSASTVILALVPEFFIDTIAAIVIISALFTIQNIAGTAKYTVMSSVMGTAYEGRASEGFGRYEAALGFARFSGPLAGGLLWDVVNPIAPFFFVGLIELFLIPGYYMGMKKYQKVLHDMAATTVKNE